MDKQKDISEQKSGLKEISDIMKTSSYYSGYLADFDNSVSTSISKKMEELDNLLYVANMAISVLKEAENIEIQIKNLEQRLSGMSVKPNYPENMPDEAKETAERSRIAAIQNINEKIATLKAEMEQKKQQARNLVAGIS